MKKEDQNGAITPQMTDGEIFAVLKSINNWIKEETTRAEGFKILEQIEVYDLSPGLQMYYRYLKGKYYIRSWKASGKTDVELLERAHDQFEDIPHIAYQNHVKARNQKYLFVRIRTKFLLSQSLTGDVSEKFLEHARRLSKVADRLYPEDASTSFAWIRKQLFSPELTKDMEGGANG